MKDIDEEEIKRLQEIASRADLFYYDVLPQIGGICIQNYENMNKLGILLNEGRKKHG